MKPRKFGNGFQREGDALGEPDEVFDLRLKLGAAVEQFFGRRLAAVFEEAHRPLENVVEELLVRWRWTVFFGAQHSQTFILHHGGEDFQARPGAALRPTS